MCVFCKIINHQIPSYIIKEDENFIAFLDISQQTPGHTLVIPRQHYSSFITAPADVSGQLLIFANDVAKLLLEKLNVKGFNIVTNAGAVAGQTIDHYHIHLLPRYSENDNYPKATVIPATKEQLLNTYQKIIS